MSIGAVDPSLRLISLVLALGLPGAAGPGHAQPSELRGVVVDRYTAHTLEGAQLFVAGTNSSVLSDSLGRFALLLPPGAAARLVVRRAGYARRDIELAADAGERLLVVLMQPLAHRETNSITISGRPYCEWTGDILAVSILSAFESVFRQTVALTDRPDTLLKPVVERDECSTIQHVAQTYLLHSGAMSTVLGGDPLGVVPPRRWEVFRLGDMALVTMVFSGSRWGLLAFVDSYSMSPKGYSVVPAGATMLRESVRDSL